MNCVEVRQRISEMFDILTPYEVDLTRAEIDPHLLRCEMCRIYLKELYEQKKREFEK